MVLVCLVQIFPTALSVTPTELVVYYVIMDIISQTNHAFYAQMAVLTASQISTAIKHLMAISSSFIMEYHQGSLPPARLFALLAFTPHKIV